MELTTKGRYAVMALADLASRDGHQAVPLADIAARQQISLSYLEQLFARLRRHGLVRSARGPGGGYRLAQSAVETRVADIILAVDEPLKITRCGPEKRKGCLVKGERCITHDLWDDLGRKIREYLTSVTLDDVISGRLAHAEESR
jgi:Rrf2 family iron-sulfur cluster assembly transcriptional regulator